MNNTLNLTWDRVSRPILHTLQVARVINKVGMIVLITILLLPGAYSQTYRQAAPSDFSGVWENVSNLDLSGLPTPYSPPQDATALPLVIEGDVKNIIFLIGDGMGLVHANAARFYVVGPEGRLHFERMPVTGLLNVYSYDALITDSAASGTALATGNKTRNGMIGLRADSTSVPTVLEIARDHGLATGLVVTSRITHATPAAYYAHINHRGREQEIAEQLSTANINVLFGGGRDMFLPESMEDSRRHDDRNLLAVMESNGYEIIGNRDELMSVEGDHVLGLFQTESLSTQLPEPTIAEMTAKAIELLAQDDDGFFLMVEGSQIDWAGHSNDEDYSIRETLLFDDAVREALAFAQQNGETLVVVTADHETGGMSIRRGNRNGEGMNIAWSTRNHSAVSVPVYAYGPGSLRFTGVIDNTDIAIRMAELFGFVGELMLEPVGE